MAGSRRVSQNRNGKKALTTYLPPQDYKALKVAAAKAETSLERFVADAIAKAVQAVAA